VVGCGGMASIHSHSDSASDCLSELTVVHWTGLDWSDWAAGQLTNDSDITTWRDDDYSLLFVSRQYSLVSNELNIIYHH